MDKPKRRKRRTLVIIDSDSLSSNRHYDLSFLESEKRLDIWFFFKNKIHQSFTLHKDYNAKSIVLPRYEEDTLSHIIKRVCYELGRRGEKYHKLYFIGDTHPLWEGLVQFFRERGYVAHHLWSEDYATTSAAHKEAPVDKDTGSSEAGHTPSLAPDQVSPTPSTGRLPKPSSASKKNKKSSSKSPLPPELHQDLITYLTEKLAGKTLPRKDFLDVLHQLGIFIKRNVRSGNFRTLMRYLAAEGLITYSPDMKEIVILSHEHSKS